MNSKIGRDKPPRPPPPPRPVLRPSKSLGGSPGFAIKPSVLPRQFSVKRSSPQLTKYVKYYICLPVIRTHWYSTPDDVLITVPLYIYSRTCYILYITVTFNRSLHDFPYYNLPVYSGHLYITAILTSPLGVRY